MVLVIDNYDSFTYNLVQYLGELGEQVKVVRNDQISTDAIGAMAPDRIVISREGAVSRVTVRVVRTSAPRRSGSGRSSASATSAIRV